MITCIPGSCLALEKSIHLLWDSPTFQITQWAEGNLQARLGGWETMELVSVDTWG